jgi:hypothetical protein
MRKGQIITGDSQYEALVDFFLNRLELFLTKKQKVKNV